MQTRQAFCSEFSSQAGEALPGTATPTRVYLLLEYTGAWGEKALEDSQVPDAVKVHLKAYSKSSPDTKVLLVKGRRDPRESGIRFFVGIVAEANPALYAFCLDEYEDLLKLDLEAITARDTRFQYHHREKPMLLVCTNGRRDACCARNGIPALNALSQAAGQAAEELVWECSHVGGHRFAANLTCLPYGVLYGRVDAGNAGAILEACLKGEIYLPNLRGRTCYPAAVQVADYYLRQLNRQAGLDAFRLLSSQEYAPGHWEVEFQSIESGEIHQLQIKVEKTGAQVYDSCLFDKQKTALQYQLEAYTITDSGWRNHGSTL